MQKMAAGCSSAAGRWTSLGVILGLRFNATEGDAIFPGLDCAGGFSIHIKQIVCEAVTGDGEFTDDHAARGMDIRLRCITDAPPRRMQQAGNILPSGGV